jgi:hypothetical protein
MTQREEEKYYEEARRSIGLIKAGHSVGAVDCDIKSLENLAKSKGNDRFLSVRADLTREADFTKDHGDEGQNR